jgi:hypothetical protein
LSKTIVVALACLSLLGCNAESPTALAAFNPALIHGRWAITFSRNACDLSEIQASFTQFSSGGPLPESIRLVGSWQVSGSPTSADLGGTLARDTGKIILELLADVRILEGIVMDEDNLVFGYSDLSTGCKARASALRI